MERPPPLQRLEVPEVRAGRRRHHGPLPPARRLGDLRRAGTHGAGLLPALPAHRRARQLRLARRRLRRRVSIHRVPPGAAGVGAARGDRLKDGRLPTELRRHTLRADRPPHSGAAAVDQRRHRHRGGHGDQHPAASPGRDRGRAGRADRQPEAGDEGPAQVDQGAGLPHGRAHPQQQEGAPGHLRDRAGRRPRPRRVRARGAAARRTADHRHVDPVHGQQVHPGVEDR